MRRRFSLAELLMGVTLVALVLAIVVPLYRHWLRVRMYSDDWVSAVAASADGSTFAAFLFDGRLMVWDQQGMPRSTLTTTHIHSHHLSVSHDGRLAALSGGVSCRVEIWDIDSRTIVRTIPATVCAHATFSPVEDLLAIQDETTELYSVHDDGPARLLPRDRICLKFSPDGAMLAVVNRRSEVEIYETATLQLRRAFRSTHLRSLRLAWAPDSKRLSVIGHDERCVKKYEDAIETWRISESDSQLPEKEVESGPIAEGVVPRSIHYLPHGRELLFADSKAGVKLLDAKSLKQTASRRSMATWHLAIGVRGDKFLTSDLGGVDLWDATTFRPRERLFDRAPRPTVFPAAFGLAACLIIIALRRRRPVARLAQAMTNSVIAAQHVRHCSPVHINSVEALRRS